MEDFHLVPALLDIANVVGHDGIEAVDLAQLGLQGQVPLGHKQALDKLERGREENLVSAVLSEISEEGETGKVYISIGME